MEVSFCIFIIQQTKPEQKETAHNANRIALRAILFPVTDCEGIELRERYYLPQHTEGTMLSI